MSTIYITSRGDAFTLDQLIQNRVGGPIHVSLMSSTQKVLTRSPAHLTKRGPFCLLPAWRLEGETMIHTELAFPFPHPAQRPTVSGRGLADAGSSPASATPEQKRLAGIRKMHRQVAAPRVDFDQRKYADLRDGGLMPREPIDRSAVYFWIVTLILGIACWTYALPKIVRAVAQAIVLGANLYH